MKTLTKIRLWMVGLLCAGMLMVGIGFGVGFGDLLNFSYGGSVMLSDSTEKDFTSDIELYDPEGKGNVYLSIDDGQDHSADCLVIDEKVKPGTVHIQARYRSVVSGLQVYHNEWTYQEQDPDEVIILQWDDSPVASFFAYLDDVVEDLKQGRLGEYREHELSDLIIKVNPADQHRIVMR